jgi:hypothetical protein
MLKLTLVAAIPKRQLYFPDALFCGLASILGNLGCKLLQIKVL